MELIALHAADPAWTLFIAAENVKTSIYINLVLNYTPPPHKHTHTQTIRFILSILCPWCSVDWQMPAAAVANGTASFYIGAGTVISPSPDCALKPTTRYEFVGWENPTITQPLALMKEDDDMCSSHKKICSRESYSCHHRPSLKIHISCAEQLSEQSDISHIHNVLSSSEPRILCLIDHVLCVIDQTIMSWPTAVACAASRWILMRSHAHKESHLKLGYTLF